MGDTQPVRPDHGCLFATASEQHGYFTAAQARQCGLSWDLLTDATKRGRYIRIRRGLYRLRDYPSSPREDVVVAWLALGKDASVVSHESALDLLGLSDIIPDVVHLTVPRSRRHLPDLQGVAVHTTTRPLLAADITTREGIHLTSATRTILDVAERGIAPEQVEEAVRQAVTRGLVTHDRLAQEAHKRGRRVLALITGALDRTTS